MDERGGTALEHLARGVEELLRAGAAVAAALREHADAHAALPSSPLLRALARLAEDAATWASGTRTHAALRAALAQEHARWAQRARDDDPTAARLRDLVEALLDVLDGEPEVRAHRRVHTD